MTYEELKKQATPGPVVLEEQSEWPFGTSVSGKLQSYEPEALSFLWGRQAAPTFSTDHSSRKAINEFHPCNAEVEAEIRLTVHCRNNFDKALSALKHMIATARKGSALCLFGEEAWFDKLIEELETVEGI